MRHQEPTARRLPHSPFLALLALLGVSPLVTSCVSYEARGLRTDNASQLLEVNEKDRMYIGATYQLDRGWQQSYLGRHVSSENVLPVEVHLQNLNSDDSDQGFTFLVEADSAVLRLADGTEIQQIAVDEVIELVRYSQFRSFCWGLFLIFPGFVVAGSVSEANVALADDYRDKTLPNRRFPPGDRENLDKLLFFKPPRPLRKIDFTDSNLIMRVTRQGGGAPGVVEERRVPLREGP